jgi:hypothetical protein
MWPEISFPWGNNSKLARASSLSRLHDRHITLGRTPLDEWSAQRRDLYLTTHNTHERQTSMPPGGIRTRNPSKWAGRRLDRAATEVGMWPEITQGIQWLWQTLQYLTGAKLFLHAVSRPNPSSYTFDDGGEGCSLREDKAPYGWNSSLISDPFWHSGKDKNLYSLPEI